MRTHAPSGDRDQDRPRMIFHHLRIRLKVKNNFRPHNKNPPHCNLGSCSGQIEHFPSAVAEKANKNVNLVSVDGWVYAVELFILFFQAAFGNMKLNSFGLLCIKTGEGDANSKCNFVKYQIMVTIANMIESTFPDVLIASLWPTSGYDGIHSAGVHQQ